MPSEAELRVAQAQLVGWLEGLFHGIQAALMAQQMSARAQLDEMRQRGLPPVDGARSRDGPAPTISGPSAAPATRRQRRPHRSGKGVVSPSRGHSDRL